MSSENRPAPEEEIGSGYRITAVFGTGGANPGMELKRRMTWLDRVRQRIAWPLMELAGAIIGEGYPEDYMVRCEPCWDGEHDDCLNATSDGRVMCGCCSR